jgi:hypothetical protein
MRFLFFLLPLLIYGKQCHFVPPPGWEIAQLKNPSPHVKVGFIGKGSTDFRPSINLATEEEVDVSLKEYVKAVKELQISDPSTKWRDLGTLPMKAGTGRLVEMSSTGPFGEIKIFQAMFVDEGTAYILTAAALKEDMGKLRSELLQSFQTLNLFEDLWSPIQEEKRKLDFKTLFLSLGTSVEKEVEWGKLQQEVKNHSDLGPFWQFLVLTEGRAKIYKE